MPVNNLKIRLLEITSHPVFLIALLSALSFYYTFNFHLFVDDWHQISGILDFPETLKTYFQIHPGNFLEFKLLSPLFKFNPYPWQFMGYLLRIIDSLSMWALVFALTSSKKAALYASLIFAAFVVGIESVIWPSAHSSAIIIPFINLGFYFWIKSKGSFYSKKNIYSLIFLTLSIFLEPGRAFIVIFLIPIWELFSIYQIFSMRKMFITLLRIVVLSIFLGSVGFLVQRYFNTSSHLPSLLNELSVISLNNIILSLDNLLFRWTLFPEQFTYWASVVFLLTNLLLLILFLWKKYEICKIIFFLSLWALLFYIPNFLTQPFSRSGMPMESRYYTLSAVGVVGLLAYGLSFIKSKYINWIIFLFLVFNLYVTNKVLYEYSTFRSVQVHNKIWNKINNDVPKDEKGSVFIYTGTNYSQRVRLLDWMNTIPFGVRRGFVTKEDYPIMATDKNLIVRLVCEKNVSRPSPFGELIQKEPIPLSHIHAWELKSNGELENRSEQERTGIKEIAKCLAD